MKAWRYLLNSTDVQQVMAGSDFLQVSRQKGGGDVTTIQQRSDFGR